MDSFPFFFFWSMHALSSQRVGGRPVEYIRIVKHVNGGWSFIRDGVSGNTHTQGG